MKRTSLRLHRREVIAALAGTAAVWPFPTLAEKHVVRRLAVVLAYADADEFGTAAMEATAQELAALGWTESMNLQMDRYFGVADVEKARAIAEQVVARRPDVIVTHSDLLTAAMRQHTQEIPIVFASVSDPVGSGLVGSLSRPGGNVTGFSSHESPIGGKWLELLKEIAPHIKTAGFVLHPETPGHVGFLSVASAQAERVGLAVVPIAVHSRDQIEQGIVAFATAPDRGLIVAPQGLTAANRYFIVALAQHHRLPAIYGFQAYARAGGLLSYGNDQLDLFRRTAGYVDRILRGEQPAELPVQTPTKYQLVINLKAANAIGLEVPATLLARADEAIE